MAPKYHPKKHADNIMHAKKKTLRQIVHSFGALVEVES